MMKRIIQINHKFLLLLFIVQFLFTTKALSNNDDCSGASNLTENTNCQFQNFNIGTGRTLSSEPVPACAAGAARDVWGTFVATDISTTINIPCTQNDPAIAIYTGTCSSLTLVACQNAYSGNATAENITFPTTIGTTYYVRVFSMISSSKLIGQICIHGPLTPSTADCSNGSTICDNSTIAGNSSGSGNVDDLNTGNSGCLSNEHQTTWVYFQAQTAGTIAFLIPPQNGTDDYDFAVWGPYSSSSGICPPSAAPLRCSYSAYGINGNMSTGLQSGAGDNSEGAGGDGVVDPIVAAAGDVYLICIDNYTATNSPFDLNWTLSSPGMLDCTPLAVNWDNFSGYADENNTNRLNWTTTTEENASFFQVERSVNAQDFSPIGQVSASGNSSTPKQYAFTDYEPNSGTNYYRLKEVDINGKYFFSKTIAINSQLSGFHLLKIFPNPTKDEFTISCFTDKSCQIEVQIINLQGKQVGAKQISLTKGYDNINYELKKSLPGGSYFIRLFNPETGISQHAFISKQ